MTESERRYRDAITICTQKIREQAQQIIEWADAIDKHLAMASNIQLAIRHTREEEDED